MRKILFIAFFFPLSTELFAQTIAQKLQQAFLQFEKDDQLKHAISSLYVIDAKTGQVVFDKNSQIGLAPASTQKIVTAATAFELLGKDYTYKTEFGYKGKIEQNILKGFFYMTGSGDPTLGSSRFASTTEAFYYGRLIGAIRKEGIRNDTSHSTYILMDLSRYSDDVYNDAWIWEDLGNYYGVGSCAFNWRENQFDVVVTPGDHENDDVKEIKVSPWYVKRRLSLNNQLRTGKPGSGDHAYFYMTPGYGDYAVNITGTVPAGVDSFVVVASHPNPPLLFTESLLVRDPGQEVDESPNYPLFGRIGYFWGGDSSHYRGFSGKSTPLYIHSSPPLDKITYWFLQKSINLYGEALLKTIAYEKNGFGRTDSGVAIVKKFWEQRGIDKNELNIFDGSGLSPQNRVTTHAQVVILKYAKKQSWFSSFYDALPEYNSMKMKSGTIKDVKGYCGYHKAKDGKEYIFSFLVNNYNGTSSDLVGKMYLVLNVLK